MNLSEVIAYVCILLLNSSASAWLIMEHGNDKTFGSFGVAVIVLGTIAGWIMFCVKVSDE